MSKNYFADAGREYKELRARHEELEKLYDEFFPKVDHGLLADIIKNTPNARKNDGRLYELQIITKEGTDSDKMRSFFMERTGRVPAPFEDGTHYLVQEYATLDMIKEIQNLEETEHIMGDYTFGAYAVSQVHRHRGEDEASRITET